MKKFYIEDTCAMEETSQFYTVHSWHSLAEMTIRFSVEHNDYVRFLPVYKGWNLDYPERGESIGEYKARLIDMAIDLQLIG